MIVIPIQFIVGLGLLVIGLLLLFIVRLVEWTRKIINKIKEKK